LPGLSFFKLDITDFQLLEDVVKQMPPLAGVIHLAARAGVRYSVEDPWTFLNTNTNGTLNLLEVSHRYGIQKFVLASTSSIYGANAPLPTPEDASSDKPLQPYAASKKGAEALCHAYHFLYDLDVTIFRYFTVYGPAGRPDMVMFRFLQWIAEGRTVHLNGDGEQSRGFTYVDDIARGTILGLKPLGYEIINLGGHETITINGMIKQLEIFLGRKASIEQHPFHKADMLSNWANIEKAKNILKWMPEITLNEGMRRMVEWYLQEREWTSQVLTP
jgi:nucleoside-diphosphate-sugar epimerase